jgi:hypothetical protein
LKKFEFARRVESLESLCLQSMEDYATIVIDGKEVECEDDDIDFDEEGEEED